MREYEISPALSELGAGFEVLLCHDGECVDIRFKRDRDDAEELGEKWVETGKV